MKPSPTEPTPQLNAEELRVLKNLVAHLEEEHRREQSAKIGEVFRSHFSAEKIAALIAEMPKPMRERFYRDYPELRQKS
jgi:hypothetical protein